MACKMWFGFQFNLSDSSDDGLYRLDLDPEGQGHQWKMISIQLGSYFGAPKKKSSRGCLTTIKYKVERDERNLPYIELGRWLCSHFQLETPLNFHKPINRKLYNVE